MNAHLKAMQAKVKKGKNVFITPGAFVIGDVTLGDDVSVWFNAVVRGDSDEIKIGDRTNVQDGVVMHVDHGTPINIGKENIIGHCAMLHGCTVGDNNLIGIKAVVLNNVKIGNYCVIGANTLLTEGMVIPDYSMVYGSPGKIVKQLPEEVKDLLMAGVNEYINEAKRYLESEV